MDQSTLKYYSDNAAQVAERYESVISNMSVLFANVFRIDGNSSNLKISTSKRLKNNIN